jgi:hypothetical protein
VEADRQVLRHRRVVPIPCTITQGKDGEFGAVRSVANEVLVGKTELSYTYTQPVRAGRPYDLYHGTLEARRSRRPRRSWSTRCLRQLDAGRRRGESRRSRAASHDLHARVAEHEDPRGGRHPAAARPARRWTRRGN